MRLPLILAAFAPILAMATPCLAQSAAPAAARPPVLVRAETCLRDKVADAVRVSTGAADAADFLMGYLCAGPVAAVANYERNTASVVAMKGMFGDGSVMQAIMSGEEESHADAALPADADGSEESQDRPALPEMGKWINSVSVDENTGDLLIADESANPMVAMIRAQSGSMGQMFGEQRPTGLRELVGRLVLDARR